MTVTTYCIESRIGQLHSHRFVVAPTAEEALEIAMQQDTVHYSIRAAGETKDKKRSMIPTLGPKGAS